MNPHLLYHQIDAANFSTLKHLAISPLRYKHNLAQPRKDTDPMRVGRLQHCAILQPPLADLWPEWAGAKRDKRIAEWREFLNKHGEDYWKDDELATAKAMAAAVRAHPIAGRLLASGVPETPITWTDAATKILCKARPDLRDGGRIVEIKTTRNALSRGMIRKQIAGLLYHGQAAFYLDGAGADSFTWIFVEQQAPHDVAVVPANSDMLREGRTLYRGWLETLRRCRETDTWPGIAPEPLDIDLPEWAMAGHDDPGLDMTGLEDAA